MIKYKVTKVRKPYAKGVATQLAKSGIDSTESVELVGRAAVLAQRVNFALWFNATTMQSALEDRTNGEYVTKFLQWSPSRSGAGWYADARHHQPRLEAFERKSPSREGLPEPFGSGRASYAPCPRG